MPLPDTTAVQDMYGPPAEFYDLLAAPAWARLGPLLRRALDRVDPGHGPLLDIGAGTGLSTETAADAVPGAQLLAVEPSAGMRIALSTRLACRPALAERVTVTAGTANDARLPLRLCAAVALGVVGHLASAERAALWRLLSERLAPGAPVVVDVLSRTAPPTRAPLRLATRRVGALTYESWSEGADDGWTLTYRVRDGETIVREHAVPLPWSGIGLDDLAEEAGAAVLVLRTVFQRDGRSWLRAGAGVMGQSTPEREWEETCEKLRSVAPHLRHSPGTAPAEPR